MHKNLFNAYKDTSLNHKIAFTGIFFALAIILQSVAKFMPFASTFIKINLSLIFILPIFYFAGMKFGISALILRTISGFGIEMFIITVNPPDKEHINLFSIEAILFGHFILLLSSASAIFFMYCFSAAFSKIKKHNYKLLLISIFTTFTTTIFLTILNMIFLTPAYFAIISHKSFSVSEAIKTYNYVTEFYFFIKNYWAGTFVVYFTGNLVKFSIIYIIYFPLSKILRRHAINKTY
ncbi:MAG: hypothetical protein GY679_02340 [Mycoplasma sp.]|nr:hypothetical protein [Mycoplasma sp.]